MMMLTSWLQYVTAIICILYMDAISAREDSTKMATTSSTTESRSTEAPDMSFTSPSSSPKFSSPHQADDSTYSTTVISASLEGSNATVISTEGPPSAEKGGDASGLTAPEEEPNPSETPAPGKELNSSQSTSSDGWSGLTRSTTSGDKSAPSTPITSHNKSDSSESTIPAADLNSLVNNGALDGNSSSSGTTTPGKASNSSEPTKPKGGPNLVEIVLGEAVASGSQQSDSASAIGFSLLTVVLTKVILW
ncbi:hypothetical protein V3C99_007411 [Haemonchus contortus]